MWYNSNRKNKMGGWAMGNARKISAKNFPTRLPWGKIMLNDIRNLLAKQEFLTATYEPHGNKIKVTFTFPDKIVTFELSKRYLQKIENEFRKASPIALSFCFKNGDKVIIISKNYHKKLMGGEL